MTARADPSPGLPARFDQALERYVGRHDGAVTPGAVVVATISGRVAYREAVGLAQVHDCGRARRRALRLDTRFDLASVTKVAATTALALRLTDRGLTHLDQPVTELVPAFTGAGKDAVTVGHLLRHDSGLSAWQPVYLYAHERTAALAWVAAQPLLTRPGTRRRYSDLGFMLLGAALEQAAGDRLDVLTHDLVFAGLGMDATGFRPVDTPSAADAGDLLAEENIAATSCGNPEEQRMIATGQPYPVDGDPAAFDQWRQRTLIGEVNDANAYHAFAGVAGHAGLFGTADDLARLAHELLAGAAGEPNQLADPGLVELFCRPTRWPQQALGWHADGCIGQPDCGLLAHGGFTGVRVGFAPRGRKALVLLANRQQLGSPPPDVAPLWRALVDALLAA